MPRKAKDTQDENIIKDKKTVAKSTSKKVATKSTTKPTKTTKVAKTAKAKTSLAKDNVENKVKKVVTKKATTKPSAKKTTAVKTKKAATKTTKKVKKVENMEYYDLPYRYNQTVVKLLAQSPNTLFIYWDISDEDRQNYIKQYGEYFFNDTKPVLIVHNETMNYSFEVDINDFANSWYLNIEDSNCNYKVELGRRPINNNVSIDNNYLYISSSNEMDSPNDHILFDTLNNTLYFKNVKTNIVIGKDMSSISLINRIAKLNKIKDFYIKMYSNENISFDRLDLNNPSSGNSTSTFK